MIESSPFNDPEFKKIILSSEGIEEAEVLDDSMDFKSLIKGAPRLPKTAKTIITDANVLAKNEKEQKAREMTIALNDVFNQYNEKYGTELSISFDDLSKTLVNVADPDSRRILELYTSEIFKSIRPVLLLHVLQRLTVALDVALDPERLLDSSQFSAADSIVLIEKLMGFIVQIQDMIKEIEIPDSDKILKKMSDDKNSVDFNTEDNRRIVNDFMKLFRNDNNTKN